MLPCYKTKLLTNWKIQLTNTKPGKKKKVYSLMPGKIP